MKRSITYKDAGVDIAKKEAMIPVFRRIARTTATRSVIDGIGGFGGMVRLDLIRSMHAPVLIAGTDGVGTKLKIAFATGRHDTVGVDCVAMCVNDIICHAARPLFFLDYLATGRLDPSVAESIVLGIAHGCREAGMSLIGGETAQMPGMYQPGEYDLAGFAVGVAERREIPDRKKVQPGDALIGIASNGLHSNGFSLARMVLLEQAKLALNRRIAELQCTLADELLRPTRIYVSLARALFTRFRLRGLANITGGGIPENLPRVLPKNSGAVIRRSSWPRPVIFQMIERLGKIEPSEMDRTFNNGIGMIAVVAASEANSVIRFLKRKKENCWLIGEVVRHRGVRFV
jgi:phosphoribosylformylglycinamidine cyclo-ligase